tara:strand:- start:27 stop:623 length:597 start_codon:yes stop_codon:yes gene_type:complete
MELYNSIFEEEAPKLPLSELAKKYNINFDNWNSTAIYAILNSDAPTTVGIPREDLQKLQNEALRREVYSALRGLGMANVKGVEEARERASIRFFEQTGRMPMSLEDELLNVTEWEDMPISIGSTLDLESTTDPIYTMINPNTGTPVMWGSFRARNYNADGLWGLLGKTFTDEKKEVIKQRAKTQTERYAHIYSIPIDK